MMMPEFRANQVGMTLLETMIALLIFSVGVLGVASLEIVGMHNNARAFKVTCDSVGGAESVESILGLPYEDPLLSDPDGGFAPKSPDHGPFLVGGTSSTIEWEVDDDFPIPNAKRVRITVRTAGNKASTATLTFDYLKAKDFV